MVGEPLSGAAKAARTTAAWRAAGERGDADAAGRCLAAGVELISPLTARFSFRGAGQVQDVLSAALEVISDITYHTEVGEGVTRALFYRGRCGDEQFEEAQLLRFDPDGLITELTLFGRPLPGLTAVMAAIGPALLRRQGRPVVAGVVAATTRPLAVLTGWAKPTSRPWWSRGGGQPGQPGERPSSARVGRPRAEAPRRKWRSWTLGPPRRSPHPRRMPGRLAREALYPVSSMMPAVTPSTTPARPMTTPTTASGIDRRTKANPSTAAATTSRPTVNQEVALWLCSVVAAMDASAGARAGRAPAVRRRV